LIHHFSKFVINKPTFPPFVIVMTRANRPLSVI